MVDEPSYSTVPGPTKGAWREAALTRAAELRGRLHALHAAEGASPQSGDIADEVLAHLTAAEEAASGRRADGSRILQPSRRLASISGASVERAISQLDAAEVALLRMAPDAYVVGQLPAMVCRARAHLPKDDPGLARLLRIAEQHAGDTASKAASPPGLRQDDREAAITTLRTSMLEERREVSRVRSFRNILLSTALALAVGAAGVLVIGIVRPSAMPLCFTPGDSVVCPTHAKNAAVPPASTGDGGSATQQSTTDAARTARLDDQLRKTATGWDVAIIELVGLMAAAVAAAVSLRSMQGTSTPYSLPTALALLKLPTGALTAVLGILLLRGQFVPGLSALDSSAQILGWAVVLGYAQQVFTKFVDVQAGDILNNVGTASNTKAPGARILADTRESTWRLRQDEEPSV
jgi:hypothetical protein